MVRTPRETQGSPSVGERSVGAGHRWAEGQGSWGNRGKGQRAGEGRRCQPTPRNAGCRPPTGKGGRRGRGGKGRGLITRRVADGDCH